MVFEDINFILDGIDLPKLCEDNFIMTMEDEAPTYVGNCCLTYTCGASKGVIIPNTENFVIKIPFTGYEWCEGDFSPFVGAPYGNGWDYCEAESILYEEAYKAGLGFLFAKTICIGKIRNLPIYIQPKCTTYSKSNFLSTKEERDSVFETCESMAVNCFDEDWLAAVKRFYGEKILLNLLNFIEEMGIGDLHGGNIGWLNNRPVLFDYSNYCG